MCRILPIILLLLGCVKLKAQCSFTVSATSTESRCKESGAIRVTPSSAGAYTYQIVAGPITGAVSTNPNFTTLPPGNYTIATKSGSCTVNTNITVSGNYQEPSLLSTTVTKIACPGGTGCVTAREPDLGRDPYTYAIISGPVTRPNQSGRVFCGLPAGNYSLQSLDSCGVVRTTQFTIANDTGDFYVAVYGWNLEFANCNDLVINSEIGFSNTSSHSLGRIWYVKPNGDTLKLNGFSASAYAKDTVVGGARTYGTWQVLGYDTCGRIRKNTFNLNPPGLYVQNTGPICGGYQVVMGNNWKYSLPVTYIVRKCRDNSIVYSSTDTPPTDWYSPTYNLQYDTCYIFESYNNCGDTVRYANYQLGKPSFNIAACAGTGCTKNGKGDITVYQDYLSGIPPITFKIIAGPEGIGRTATQGQWESWVNFRDLTIGTYKIEGTDGCGQKDTTTVNLNTPLSRKVDITKTPNCSGGANIHVKITSNFYNCQIRQWPWYNNDEYTYVTTTSPGYSAVNITKTPIGPNNEPSVWDADYIGVTSDSLRLITFANNGCEWDTTFAVNPYIQPRLTNLAGYVCTANNTATLAYSLTGGTPPFQYRIKKIGPNPWGAWQNNTIFTGMTEGGYDVEMRDGCPNGSITSITLYKWDKSDISVSTPCTDIGATATLTADPIINGINYTWIFNNAIIGTGPVLTIPNFTYTNTGIYSLKQVFPGGSCIDTAKLVYFNCNTLPVGFDKLYGTLKNAAVELTWKTFQEANELNFEIEKSTNGTDFFTINTLPAKNNGIGNEYAYTDIEPATSAYYRIKYVDKNNNNAHSNIVYLKKQKQAITNATKNNITINPIPFKDVLNIQINSTTTEPFTFQLIDFTGKLVMNKTVNCLKGINNIVLNEGIEQLVPGVYAIKIMAENIQYNQKILKK